MGYGLVLLILGAIWAYDLSAQPLEKASAHTALISKSETTSWTTASATTANGATVNSPNHATSSPITETTKAAVIVFLITLMVATVWKIRQLAQRC